MSMKFLALIGGGIGPDVWDREIELGAADIDDAFGLARIRAEESGGQVFSIAQLDHPQWTQIPPQYAGLWWLWNGDEDQIPFPVTIMYSGTSGKCFVATGQWGWTRHQEFDELENAWWMPCIEPVRPK